MAGLLTAAAIARFFDEVVVLERDDLPDTPVARRGVPQARHLHGLLPRGVRAIEELLPGYTERLEATGGRRGELLRDSRWILNGRALARAEGDLWGVGASRPLIEAQVRRDVRALANVSLVGGARAHELIARDGRVCGVHVRPETEHGELQADLVVDARGRAATVEEWLSALGAPVPPRSEVRVDVGYWSARYRVPAGTMADPKVVFIGPDERVPRGGAAMRIEGDDVMVLLAAYDNAERAPRDPDEMTAFAASLAAPDVHDILRVATPLDAIAQYRVRANVRRHFERLTEHPEGYVVLGDAHTAFNPIYGQGMTVAALAALELQRELAAGLNDLPRRYYRAAARVVDDAWRLATGADLRFPSVQGERHWSDQLLARWIDRVVAGAASDPMLTRTFLGVTGLVDSPARLFAPDTVRRVLWPRAKPTPSVDASAGAAAGATT